ncbi:hypothetical protein ACFL0Z_00555 [Patescibacteria group bacterium]
MPKLLITICLIISVGFIFSGCSFSPGEAVSKVVKHEGENSFDLPEGGEFFKLERTDKVGDHNEYVEVTYDGEVKFNTGQAKEEITKASKDQLTQMYDLIKAKNFDGLKQELKLDNSEAGNFDETLTLFTKEGQQEIFNITAEDLTTGEDTVLPDKWDVYLTKFRRFLGALTGEEDTK